MAQNYTQTLDDLLNLGASVRLISALLTLVLLSGVFGILYRLCFHPLRRIPGPRLAAVSSWYSLYWNFFRDGQYVKLFPSLHEKYKSPVIRIAPNHVHVNDPEFYDEVFGASSNYLKDPAFYLALGAEGAMLSIIDSHELRTYRKSVGPLFAARAADAVLPALLNELEKISAYALESLNLDRPVNIQRLYRALAADVACDGLFTQNPNFLDSGHEYHPLLKSLEDFTTGTWMIIHFPVIKTLVESLPSTWQEKMTPELFRFKTDCEGWVKKAIDRYRAGITPDRKSLFDYYLDLNPQDASKPSCTSKLAAAAFDFLNAGIDPTAYTLSCTTYYILNFPEVLSKLQAELDASISSIRPDFDAKKILALPYLTAVIKESLRLCNVAPGCLPRVVPTGGARIGNKSIPAGTVISISQYAITTNATIFPAPDAFRPERWLDTDLDRWNVAFSKGTRRCAGINLAHLELYTCIAYLFSRFDMALFETDARSMEWSDRIVAHNKSHVHVKVVGERWH